MKPRRIIHSPFWLVSTLVALLVTSAAPGRAQVTHDLQLWLKSDAGVTTSSSYVTNWADQSGNGHVAYQNSSYYQPKLVPNVLNGYPAIRFDGTSDYMWLVGQVIHSQQYTIVAVVNDTRSVTDGGFREVLSNWTASDNMGTSVFFGTTNHSPIRARLTDDFGGALDPDHLQTGVGDILDPQRHFVFTGISSATDALVYQNLRLIAAKGSPISARKLAGYPYKIGCQNGWELWQGDMVEILIYDVALSETELAETYAYLAAKYGLSGAGLAANAGPDQTVHVPHDGDPAPSDAPFTLDGSHSVGDSLAYEWSEGGSVIATSPTVSLTRTVGSYTFTLKVTDSKGAAATDDVVITVLPEVNHAPKANAGPDRAIVSTVGLNVQLDGSGSSDPDHDPLTYVWTEGAQQIATGVAPTVFLEPGSHTITLTVTDSYGAASSDTVAIYIGEQTYPFMLYSLNKTWCYVGEFPPTFTAYGVGFQKGALLTWDGVPMPTTFLSTGALRARLTPEQIAAVGVFQVGVLNPDGAKTNTLPYTVKYRVPYLSGLDPETIAAGSPGFTLKVIGERFVPGALVIWNGQERPTTFVSSTLLEAEISAADVAVAGEVIVRVLGPGPGGGLSNRRALIVQ